MQEKDPLEEHYKRTFSGFEPQPPGQAWEKIRTRIHPPDVRKGRMAALKDRLAGLRHSGNLYPLLAAAAMVLILVFIWFSYSHKHSIRGHAYAGEARMCLGTAYLFKVYDKVKPFDTVLLVESVKVDDKGFYQFLGIDRGNYLIRVNPLPGTDITGKYLPSFYDQDSALPEAKIIRIDNEDPTVDIHLVPK